MLHGRPPVKEVKMDQTGLLKVKHAPGVEVPLLPVVEGTDTLRTSMCTVASGLVLLGNQALKSDSTLQGT